MTAKVRPTPTVVGVVVSLTLVLSGSGGLAAAPDGRMTHAVPFALASALFDPADYNGSLSSLLTFYALHDALDRRRVGRPQELRPACRVRRLQERAGRRWPYRFGTFTPGVELVVEAHDG